MMRLLIVLLCLCMLFNSVVAEEKNSHRKTKKVKETDWPTVSPSPSKNNGKNNNKDKGTDAPIFRPTLESTRAPVISATATKIPAFAPVVNEETSAPAIPFDAPVMPAFTPVFNDKNNGMNSKNQEGEETVAPVMPAFAPVMPAFAPVMPVFAPVAKDKNKDKNGKNQEVDETDEPTAAPSLRPTFVPTITPAIPPVSDPVPEPTPVPIPEPTPVPIPETTVPPSDGPTPGPTKSFAPSIAVVVTRVFLPKMEIEFRVTEGPVVAPDLETEIRLFVKDVVVSNAKILGELRSVELDVSVSLRGRRRLEAKLVASIVGAAFFEGDSHPSTNRLKEVLTAYFANWGDVDLEDHLTSGKVQVQGVEVAIDGDLVESLSPDTETNRAMPNEEGGSDNNSISTGLVIGLVIGCTVLAGALVLVYIQRHKTEKPSSVKESSRNSTPVSSPSIRSRGGLEAPPKEINPANFRDRDELSFSGISMDEQSLYTDGTPRSKENYPHSSQNSDTRQYDHTRLDKVISGAHDFVATHEEADEQGGQDSFPSYDDDSTIESIEGHRAYI